MKATLVFLLLCAGHVNANQSVLVISGMSQESNIASGENVITVMSGANPAVLAAALAKIDPSMIKSVISFGVAGGLNPALNAGAVVLATGVVDENGASYPVDANLLRSMKLKLKRNYIRYRSGLMAGSSVELTD